MAGLTINQIAKGKMHLHEKQNFKSINRKEGDNLLRLNIYIL